MTLLDVHLKNHLRHLAMRSQSRKVGFFLAAAAVVFTAFCLPLHYHSNEATTPDSAQCTVCHFSKEARSGTPELSLSFEAPSNDGTVVESPVLRTFYSEIHTPASSRAPPTV